MAPPDASFTSVAATDAFAAIQRVRVGAFRGPTARALARWVAPAVVLRMARGLVLFLINEGSRRSVFVVCGDLRGSQLARSLPAPVGFG